MQQLAMWIEKEAYRSIPWPQLIVGGLFTLPVSWLPALLTFGAGKSGMQITLILLGLAVGWFPAALYWHKNRYRPRWSFYMQAHLRGRLAEAVGPQAMALNQAASNLEQVTVLIARYKGNDIQKADVIRRAEFHMRRMLNLAIGTPAVYGLSRMAADLQVEADGVWLSRMRQLCEQIALQKTRIEEYDSVVEELISLATAREEAIKELDTTA